MSIYKNEFHKMGGYLTKGGQVCASYVGLQLHFVLQHLLVMVSF